MKRIILTAFLGATLTLSACQKQEEAAMPAPYALTLEAMGRYCGMNVLEHAGPKGQIILEQIPEPIWFSSARDTVAFTLLPDEPKEIAAIYVSDMAKAPDWEKPGAENWVDARKAFYVIGSSRRGGMGAQEAVPFSTQEAANAFAGTNGGNVVGFSDIPKSYILGSEGDSENESETAGHDHG